MCKREKNTKYNIFSSYSMDYSLKNKYNLGAGIKMNSFI